MLKSICHAESYYIKCVKQTVVFPLGHTNARRERVKESVKGVIPTTAG